MKFLKYNCFATVTHSIALLNRIILGEDLCKHRYWIPVVSTKQAGQKIRFWSKRSDLCIKPEWLNDLLI